MKQYRFVKKWDPDETSIDWQKKSRKELNKIIKAYNDWQINGFDRVEAHRVLALIEYGKQTIGDMDGGSEYNEELEGMMEFVKKVLEAVKRIGILT